MDGGAQEWQGQEEVQASEQGSIHLKDVPERRFGHRGAEEPAHHREINRDVCSSAGHLLDTALNDPVKVLIRPLSKLTNSLVLQQLYVDGKCFASL